MVYLIIHLVSILHISNLSFHVLYSFLQIEHFLSQHVLIFTQVVGIFFYSAEESFIVVYWLVDCLVIFVQIFFIDLAEVIEIPVDAFIGLFVLQFDIVEQFGVGCDLLFNSFEENLYFLYFVLYGLALSLFHNN